MPTSSIADRQHCATVADSLSQRQSSSLSALFRSETVSNSTVAVCEME
jgi:hypothetical protein